MTTDNPRRHWFQFSLKALMLLVLAATIPCVWLKSKMDHKARERTAVAEIKSIGGFVMYDWENDDQVESPGPPLLRKLLGDDFFSRVVWSDINGHKVTDGSLVYLEPLADLEFVDLSGGMRITDNGLAHLTALSRLQVLVLGAGVTDTGVAHLKELTNLRELIVGDSRLTDAGIAELKKALPNCTIYR
jgi:hypothetical protein